MASVNGVTGTASYPNLHEEAPPRAAQAAASPPASTSRARGPVRRETLSPQEASDYADNAAGQVREAYRAKPPKPQALATPPVIAATQKLKEVTDSRERPYVTPEIAARIFEKLRTDQQSGAPSTMDRVLQDLSLDGADNRTLATHPAYPEIIRNLSASVDNLRGTQELHHISRYLAEHIGFLRKPHEPIGGGAPNRYASRFDAGFKLAAADGNATLALETAKQLANPEAKFDKQPHSNWDPRVQAGAVINAVREGTEQYNRDTHKFFGVMHQNLAPVLAPLRNQGEHLSDAQQKAGVANIFKTVKGGHNLLERIQNDRREADVRGYKLLKFGETIGHYKQSLGNLQEFGALTQARGDLLNSTAGTTMVLLSRSAGEEIHRKIAPKLPEGRYSEGQLAPQRWGLLAQAADFKEYFLETYKLKRAAAEGIQPIPKHTYGTYGAPDRRTAVFNMPRDVAGLERAYDTGEYRRVPPNAPRLHPGVYDIDPSAVGVKHSPYQPTRMGVIPKWGVAVWGVGGAAQAALTEYIFNEVGFEEGQGYRKALLVGLVGGFAGFHLMEAGMAGARLMSDNQPWTRYSIAGTSSVTGTLAALMSIATAWDISGVYHSITGSHNESQGAAGLTHWKTATHTANLGMDALLLRLQLSEFSKRMLPSLIDRYGESAVAVKVAAGVARSRALSYIGTRFILSENPIGATVNVVYAGTAVTNYLVDRVRYVADMQTYDKAFLQGAGVNEMQAEILADHSYVTTEARSRGFMAGYGALNGANGKYVDYVNGLTNREDFEETVHAARRLRPEMKQEDPNAAYYALPKEDPAKTDLSRFPTIQWNHAKQRFEDSASGLYYDAEWNAWRREDHMGDAGWYYYPAQLVSEEYGKRRGRTPIPPTGVDGWRAFLTSRGQLPPN
jgi:hypothetical protein